VSLTLYKISLVPNFNIVRDVLKQNNPGKKAGLIKHQDFSIALLLDGVDPNEDRIIF
jgi:hypothetical protein